MRSFKHFHEESVDRCVTDQLKEEQVLQALQADGSQGRQPEKELREPTGDGHKRNDSGVELWAVNWMPLLCGAGRHQGFTFPAALGISVCNRLPATRRPSL